MTQHDPGTRSPPWLPPVATSGQHTSKIVPTNSCIIIGLDAIAAAGEDGECRLDDNQQTQRIKKKAKSRRGRLGSDGAFETTRKRGKGSVLAVWAARVATLIRAKSASNGQEMAVAQTDLIMMDDCTCGSLWHRSFEHPSSGGKGKTKDKEWVGEEGGVSRWPNEPTWAYSKNVRFYPILNFGLSPLPFKISVFFPTRFFRQFWADPTFSAIRSTFLAEEEAQNLDFFFNPTRNVGHFWAALSKMFLN